MRAVDVLVGDVVHRNGDSEHARERDEVFADVAVADSAVVCAPVCHDGVDILERALAGESRSKPGGRPGRVGAHVELVVYLIGQGGGVALSYLKHRAETHDDVDSYHCHGHDSLSLEVRGVSAASEISEVCGAPVGSLEHSVDILVGDVPPLLHDRVAVLVLADAGGVKRGGAGVDEVDEAVLGNALGAHAADSFNSVGAPVCTNIGEQARSAGDEFAQKHRQTVETVVLGSESERLFLAVPVEGGVEHSLGEVAVGHEIGPLALTLEAAEYGVAAESLFVPAVLRARVLSLCADGADIVELIVAEHDVAADKSHLDDELPLLLLLLGGVSDIFGVLVEALGAVFFDPLERALIFLVVIDAELDAAGDFDHVDPLGADAEILLPEIGVAERACDTHCDSTYADIRLASELADSRGAACEAENLLGNIIGN